MGLQFVPLYYEKSITEWLKLRFPNVKPSAIITVDQNLYHVLVSEPSANAIKTFVTENVCPPFKRRTLDPPQSTQPKFEPGLYFEYYETKWPAKLVRNTMAAYRAALAKLSAADERDYVQGQIDRLSARTGK